MSEASRIQIEAEKMGLQIPFPISYFEFLRKDYCRKGIKGFLIDDADVFLQSLSAVPINSITVCSIATHAHLNKQINIQKQTESVK
jgi:hypothetical protein